MLSTTSPKWRNTSILSNGCRCRLEFSEFRECKDFKDKHYIPKLIKFSKILNKIANN